MKTGPAGGEGKDKKINVRSHSGSERNTLYGWGRFIPVIVTQMITPEPAAF